MNTEEKITRIQLGEDEARKAVKFGELAAKLESNTAFRTVILEGYMEKEAVRLVHLFSDPTIEEETREKIKLDMHAIGTLMQYLRNAVQFGRLAEQELAAYARQREEVESGDEIDPTEDYSGSLGA